MGSRKVISAVLVRLGEVLHSCDYMTFLPFVVFFPHVLFGKELEFIGSKY